MPLGNAPAQLRVAAAHPERIEPRAWCQARLRQTLLVPEFLLQLKVQAGSTEKCVEPHARAATAAIQQACSPLRGALCGDIEGNDRRQGRRWRWEYEVVG